MGAIPNVSPLSMSTIATQIHGVANSPRSLKDLSRTAYDLNNSFTSLNANPNAISEFKGWYQQGQVELLKYIDISKYSNTYNFLGEGALPTGVTEITLCDSTYGFTLRGGLTSFTNVDITLSTSILLNRFRCHWGESLIVGYTISIYKNGSFVTEYYGEFNSTDSDQQDSFLNAQIPTSNFQNENPFRIGQPHTLSCSYMDTFRYVVKISIDASNATTKTWLSDEPLVPWEDQCRSRLSFRHSVGTSVSGVCTDSQHWEVRQDYNTSDYNDTDAWRDYPEQESV